MFICSAVQLLRSRPRAVAFLPEKIFTARTRSASDFFRIRLIVIILYNSTFQGNGQRLPRYHGYQPIYIKLSALHPYEAQHSPAPYIYPHSYTAQHHRAYSIYRFIHACIHRFIDLIPPADLVSWIHRFIDFIDSPSYICQKHFIYTCIHAPVHLPVHVCPHKSTHSPHRKIS